MRRYLRSSREWTRQKRLPCWVDWRAGRTPAIRWSDPKGHSKMSDTAIRKQLDQIL